MGEAAGAAVQATAAPSAGAVEREVSNGVYDSWAVTGTWKFEGWENICLGVVVTSARWSEDAGLLAAQSGNEGLDRAVFPGHARVASSTATERVRSRGNAPSADGPTIVGHGLNPAHQDEVWIAYFPEPTSGMLVVVHRKNTPRIR